MRIVKLAFSLKAFLVMQLVVIWTLLPSGNALVNTSTGLTKQPMLAYACHKHVAQAHYSVGPPLISLWTDMWL